MEKAAKTEDALNRLLPELRSKNDDVRAKAAKELRAHVSAVSRELSGENFTKFINDINRRIFELVNSNDYHDKLGGILAIDELIDIDGEDNTTKISRFANYLRIVLPGIDPQVSALAAKALGRLAMAGGTLTPEFVEFEIKRSLEWLQGDRNDARRHAAVLVLKELAVNAPILFYPYVAPFFDNIWGALRDNKVNIREGAADAVRACLLLIYQRESSLRQQWYLKLYEEAQKGFKLNTTESVHGSLLTTRELLQHTGGLGGFLQGRYSSICDVIIKNKDHRDTLVKKTVISLMPLLATFNPEVFAQQYLSTCMVHLLATLKKEKERSSAFLAIGEVAIAVKAGISAYLDPILVNIKENLAPKSKKGGIVTDPSVFQCISMLARAVGQALTKHMHQLLEQMFATGLSEPLTVALVDLAVHIAPLLPSIQSNLLDMLSVTLSGQTYRYPGAPLPDSSSVSQASISVDAASKDLETITLALRTLGSFDFSGHSLHEFVRESVVLYLEDDHMEVRQAAAQTCCHLLARDNTVVRGSSSRTTQIVGDVLEKLLIVGITDPEPTIRQTVLSSLDKGFDNYLAQAENVRTLFIALNDEVFAIRELAIGIIGRLTVHNPAYVMPSLRKTLIQLLTELEFSSVSRNKEESAQLLGNLMGAAKRLIKPYAAPILKVLLSKLKDPSPGVSARVLAALGELSQVAGEDMIQFLDLLLPLIIEMLQDQSSAAKREAALVTLGKLVTATGYVIEPYLRYPQLLSLLINFLKTEQQMSLRREAMKVLGILGALDPYRQRMGLLETSSAKTAFTDTQATEDAATEQLLMNMSPSHEDYYPTVVINALMKILRDPSLASHHTSVIQAVMLIFKTLGLKCVPFLPQIMRPYLNMMQTCPQGMVEFHFNNLAQLVSIVRQHIRNYLDEIFALIKDNWNLSSSIQVTSVSLITAIAVSLEGEFKIYLPSLLPLMLVVFETEADKEKDKDSKQPTKEVLTAFKRFGTTLEEYLHLVIPVIVRYLERPDVPVPLRKAAIQTVGQLCRKINFSDYASRIIHPLTRVISNPQTVAELRPVIMDTLAALAYQLGPDYITFVVMVNKVIVKNRIIHPRYDMLVQKLLKNESMPQELGVDVDDSLNEPGPDETAAAETTAVKKLTVNQQKLKKAWEASQRSTKDDWIEWIRRFSVELLKESPSHALRACAALAAVYYPLARELFNAAFVSCWTELYDQYQDELVKSLETALTSPQVPPEILQTLLNLAEFMEHDDKPLPIPIRTLSSYSTKCHAYAKALHYKEVEFHSSTSTQVIENLISINNQLQQPDAAMGILTFAQTHHNVELKESWYEKLHRWEDALTAYDAKQREDPLNFDITLGRMRCLQALGDFERLSQVTQEKWQNATDDIRKQIAPMGAAAAWGLWQWELMDDYIAAMNENSPDGAFFRAILSLHRNQFATSQLYIDKTRDLLDAELTALMNESYNRSFNVVVRVQMLAELEEIVQYKQLHENPEAQEFIRATWNKRLKGTQRNVDVWQRILKIHSLVVSSQEDMEMWIKFANLCRKSGRYNLCQKTLVSLYGADPETSQDPNLIFRFPQVSYSYLKYFWSSGHKNEAFTRLSGFTARLSEHEELRVTHAQLLARCHLKLGQWYTALDDNLTSDRIPQMLKYFNAATQFDSKWYKAWHSWALANFEVISHYEMKGETATKSQLVVPAIHGFFRSVALSSGNSLQDTLRLLTLWFKYGYTQEVHAAINDGLTSVTIDTWLQVIPQLIARIHAPSANVRRLIHQLLSDVGKQHPQALIYPVTVASKSQSVARKNAANSILDKMRQHSATLVDQAILVSQELIRVAILWHEMWHEGLEEASRQFFGDKNIEGMLATLEPLHAMMERGPETLREISFNQAFGHDLQEAHEWCKKYKRSQNVNDLNQAWDLYYLVFKRINKQLPTLTTLEFQYVSPKLLVARDLDLAVPGTYRSGEPIVRIGSFVPTLNVISSKQRPRKLTIMGSDGSEYHYLLKGHEDLRQDERVMQLFGLVNTLLAGDMETFKRHLTIHRYPVIPLSPNSGLIGWVPHCDTLHALIRDYRESRKILLNIEHRLMQQMAPNYESLTLMQKVEVFQYALENTTGQDVYRVLWLKSKNSEAWLDRRTNYTRSLAVMSMVGYILGLGDRHPSNLMLDRFTGKVIHIDFGDCFCPGTPVALQCGLSRPIESFPRFGGASVLAASSNGDGVRVPVGKQTRMLVRGERDVVRVTMSDGTTVTCTPEHKFMTASGEWVEIQKLLNQRVAVGPSGPLDEPAADEMGWSLDLGDELEPLVMDTPAARDRALAFARVSGYMLSDGTIESACAGSACCLGSQLDVDSFVADCQLLASTKCCNVTDSGSVFTVALPSVIMRALVHVGHPVGRKIDQAAALPVYVLDPVCPRSIVREFLGGLFGGDGWSPVLINDGKSTKDNPLDPVGFRLKGVKLVQHTERVHEKSMQQYVKDVAMLLALCGVTGGVAENSIKAKRSEKGPSTHETTVEIRLTLPANSAFGTHVGFRHCVQKQLRLAAATSFWRYKETLAEQHSALLDLAASFLKEDGSLSCTAAVQKAVDAFKADGTRKTLLPDAIPKPYVVSRHAKNCNHGVSVNKIGLSPFKYMENIDALCFWNVTGGNPRSSNGRTASTLPSYSLEVVEIVPAGRSPTYDLSVDTYTSFLAGGLVVHNCFEVAMQREKFPERFPFRLTRMLVNAMEVSGIEGNFRTTCENVMRVLRDNKESLMAVLEAFVYDPLINWRLLTNKDAPQQDSTKGKDKSGGDVLDDIKVGRSKVLQRNENELVGQEEDNLNRPEVLNQRAVAVINRVSNKLTGRDFKQNEVLDVPSQVERLIQQATSLENLCQCYIGWCPFW